MAAAAPVPRVVEKYIYIVSRQVQVLEVPAQPQMYGQPGFQLWCWQPCWAPTSEVSTWTEPMKQHSARDRDRARDSAGKKVLDALAGDETNSESDEDASRELLREHAPADSDDEASAKTEEEDAPDSDDDLFTDEDDEVFAEVEEEEKEPPRFSPSPGAANAHRVARRGAVQKFSDIPETAATSSKHQPPMQPPPPRSEHGPSSLQFEGRTWKLPPPPPPPPPPRQPQQSGQPWTAFASTCREAFSQFGDGPITTKKLGIWLRVLGQNPTEAVVQDQFNAVDAYGNRFVDFLSLMAEKIKSTKTDAALIKAFKEIFTDEVAEAMIRKWAASTQKSAFGSTRPS